jgi:hypothetical protein
MFNYNKRSVFEHGIQNKSSVTISEKYCTHIMNTVLLSRVTNLITSLLKNASLYYTVDMHQPTYRRKAGSRESTVTNGDILQIIP